MLNCCGSEWNRWDLHIHSTLAASQENSYIEDAQYLPQNYIEDVCNDFGDVFQKEIDSLYYLNNGNNANNQSEIP